MLVQWLRRWTKRRPRPSSSLRNRGKSKPRACRAFAVERLEDRTLLNGGGLDPTFGDGGQVLTELTGSLNDSASGVARQADGKLVVVGSSDKDFAVARYNPDGSLDPTFGTGGKVTTPVGAGSERPVDVVIQADGKIVVVGSGGPSIFIYAASSAPDAPPIDIAPGFSLVRYNSDGTLDTSFGRDGILTIDVGQGFDNIRAIALQGDGKFVVAGSSTPSATAGSANSDFFVARINTNGSLDTSFGKAGFVTTDFASGQDSASGVVVLPDGRIVVAGTSYSYSKGNSFALARYNADGSLDTTFGTNGEVTTDVAGASAASIVLQTDGKIVVAGSTNQFLAYPYNFRVDSKIMATKIAQPLPVSDFYWGHPRIVLARYNTNGSLDTTFGSGGEVTTDFGVDFTIDSTILQADGKIVVGGTTFTYNTNGVPGTVTHYSHFALTRYNTDGSLDTNFGAKGLVQTDFGVSYDSAASLVVQADGKIVAVGRTDLHNGDFAAARYNTDGNLDATFGTGGKVTADFMGTVNAYASAADVQADGKIVVVGIAGTEIALVRYNTDGSLDVTFGVGGQVVTDVGSYASVAGLVIQADGKIVVAGSAGGHVVLARFNANGSLDTSFGVGGKVTSGLGGYSESVAGIALQADGKIVVVGGTNSFFVQLLRYVTLTTVTRIDDGIIRQPSVFVARYNADGSLDTTFGSGGKVTTALGQDFEQISGVIIQSDGKIVVAGTTRDANYNESFTLVRLNGDGSLDSSFGKGGKVSTQSGHVTAVALQRDGRIIVAGYQYVAGAGSVLILNRYNTDGSLDGSFGAGGKVISTSIVGADVARVAIQSDGKILVTEGNFGLSRFNGDGSLDTSFGKEGKVVIHFEVPEESDKGVGPLAGRLVTDRVDFQVVFSQPATSIVLQADGKIIVVGSVSYYEDGSYRSEFALARLLPDGGDPSPYERFVAQIYQELLHRSVDAAGLAHWADMLGQGALRDQVVLAIETSTEYRTHLVDSLYTSLLGRPADSDGLHAFVSLLDSGATAESVKAAILGSPEYLRRAGGTNLIFLSTVYHDVLGREVDPRGATAFMAELANGVSREEVAKEVLTSKEAERDLVQSYYQQALHRNADEAGLDAFVKAMQQDARDEAIRAAICGSKEYFERF
jgi:uncharacterized delta-60 repeat protein